MLLQHIRLSDPGFSCAGQLLCQAAELGYASQLKHLLEGSQNPIDAVDTPFGGKAPLQFAAKNGHIRSATLLLSRGADSDSRANAKKNPILHACMNGDTALVNLLLSRVPPANISVTTSAGANTPSLCR
ncbi:hypothetical protein QBC34DRAFT_390663 [Podospora aff. communis PSN243]|uniref:Ankyrin n=1 Tax=Podospora aff. communis PSN243 TaxID=3040156 RepID=A0AAV9H5D3_9PEZI|nr:hypothetical protein QBC34DRAFT_390663 [Podospora aff. communis PSN243]